MLANKIIQKIKKISFPSLLKYLFLSILIINTNPISAENVNSITVNNNMNGIVKYKSFTLLNDETVKISGLSYGIKKTKFSEPSFYGWIINSKSRKKVWNLLEEYKSENSQTLVISKNNKIKNEDDKNKGKYYNFTDELFLKKGTYELYYTGMYKDNEISISFSEALGEFGELMSEISEMIENNEDHDDIGKIIKKKILLGRDPKNNKKYNKNLNISISIDKKNIQQLEKNDPVNNMTKEAIISITRTGDDENIEKGFTLKKETELSIYSIGEVRKDGEYDFSRIINLDNHETVWSLSYDNRNIKYAGGGKKNQFVKENIVLKAGDYMVSYITDDSHSFNNWNVLPPNDPQFWGITIWATNINDKTNIIKLDKSKIQKPFIEITKVGNYANEQVGFSLSQKSNIRILALGEGNHRMVDFATIINADTRETVWKMQRKKTQHAGGASKNRKVMKTLELKKGNYIVIYKSDDSHCYNDWNSSAPHDKERWGVTIWADKGKNSSKKIKTFDPENYKNKDIVCQILRVRNDKYISKSFKLTKDTKLRIIALGEGYKPDLADYGWIENDLNGQIMWEMTYKKTNHAGGAKKNRSFNGTIMLPKGEYNLIYKTDDSHSYDDWNSTPPNDEDRYGIILMKE